MDIVIPPSVTASLGMSEAKAVEPVKAKAPKEEAPKAEKKVEAKEAPKDLTPAEKKIWKLKANGKEVEFDASDEERIKQAVTKGLGADETFQTAAQYRKQAEQFFSMLKDPVTLKQVLTDPRVGVDLKKFAEEYVWEQMQEAQLTPEQKRQRDVDNELKKYRDAEANQKTEAEAAQAKALEAHYEADFEQRILTALKSGGVPNTKGAVRRMGYYLQQAIANNIDLQPADLVQQVRKDLQQEHQELYSTAPSETLLELLGEDLAKKLRQEDLKRLKTTQPEKHRKENTPSRKTSSQSPKKLSGDEWREQLHRKMLGK